MDPRKLVELVEEPSDARSLLVGHLIVLGPDSAVERVRHGTGRSQIIEVRNAQAPGILLVGILCLDGLLDALACKDLEPVINLLIFIGSARDE